MLFRSLYPLFGNFSEDLHSIGQFLQDGTCVIFETFLEVENSGASYVLRDDEVDDRFGYLDGKDFDEINRAACEATVAAHSEKFPCLRLRVPAVDEESFGQLFYFFEFTCYLSARILGVNPFNQPGWRPTKTTCSGHSESNPVPAPSPPGAELINGGKNYATGTNESDS